MEVEVTNDRPWRLADLTFVPAEAGRERATLEGVEVVRENGRYWILTPNGPLWSNIDERGVDPALNYLFGKRKQEQSSQVTDKWESEVISCVRIAIDELKRRIITKDECVARLYQVAAEIEGDQWRIIEDLRTGAPDNERELAREVADLLEKELRKGPGTA
jgi:hypothetical protein